MRSIVAVARFVVVELGPLAAFWILFAALGVKAAIAGIKSLADVTGNNLLARCLVPLDSPYAAGIPNEEAANGVYTNRSAGWIWVGNTSRNGELKVPT